MFPSERKDENSQVITSKFFFTANHTEVKFAFFFFNTSLQMMERWKEMMHLQ